MTEDYIYRNLVRDGIEEFKGQDIDSIEYKYTDKDWDEARMMYGKDFYAHPERYPKSGDMTHIIKNFLTPQSVILPVRDSYILNMLVAMFVLMDTNDMLQQFKEYYDTVKDNHRIMPFNYTRVNNELKLEWHIYNDFIDVNNNRIKFNTDKDFKDEENQELRMYLIYALTDFVFVNCRRQAL